MLLIKVELARHFDNKFFHLHRYVHIQLGAQFENQVMFIYVKQTAESGAATKAFAMTTQPESVLRCFIE